MSGIDFIAHAQRVLDRSPTPPQFLPADDPLRIVHELLKGDEIESLNDEIADLEGEIADLKQEIAALEDAAGDADEPDAEANKFFSEVREELRRARSKFPGDQVVTIALAEEFGELCKAILQESREEVRREAVQTAAMAARVALDGDGSVTAWRAGQGLDALTESGGAR